VPALPAPIAVLAGVGVPVLQSSANRSGEPDARTLDAVDRSIREGVDLVLDGGKLGGVASTVVDLRDYEAGGEWSVLRDGAADRAAIARVLG
jgi:L-threonylcarbamoyladenylate synthase